MTSKVKEEIGLPDIVVNNAGSFYMQVQQTNSHIFNRYRNRHFELKKLRQSQLEIKIAMFRTFVSATTPAGRGWWLISDHLLTKFSWTPTHLPTHPTHHQHHHNPHHYPHHHPPPPCPLIHSVYKSSSGEHEHLGIPLHYWRVPPSYEGTI